MHIRQTGRLTSASMNNIDRFLRVIYADADIEALLNLDASRLSYEPAGFGEQDLPVDFWLGPDGWGDDGPDGWGDETPFSATVVGRYLERYPKTYSKEEVELLLDLQLANARGSRDEYPLNSLELVRHAASSLLECKNGRLAVRQGMLMEWNGVANRIDQNILFAAYDECHGIADHPAYVSVFHGDERLERILSQGVAENHAHLKGSGYSAEINWYCLHYLQNQCPEKLRGALSSLLSSRWLHPDLSPERVAFSFAKVPMLRSLLDCYAQCVNMPTGASGILRDEDAPSQAELCDMFLRLFQAKDDIALDLLFREGRFQYVQGITAKETASAVLERPSSYFDFEFRFLRKMFEMFRLKPLSEHSPIILYGFNVYIAALSQFKLWLSHDNLLMGFSRFSMAETQKELLIDYIHGGKQMLYRSVFDRYYRSGGVRYVELRIPPKPLGEYISIMDDLKRANKQAYDEQPEATRPESPIEFRMAVHFIKDGKRISLKDFEARKDSMIEGAERGMNGLCKLFEMADGACDYPGKIAAIDTANFEMNTRPEVYGPVYRRFIDVAGKSHDVALTYHVGEDFPTLCDGLRAIDEAVVFLGLGEGDRLGHATALGLDVERYFALKRRYVTSTLQDYVDDIAWMWGLLTESAGDSSSLLAFLSREYDEYVQCLFSEAARMRGGAVQMSACEAPSISEYMLAYELRGNDPYAYLCAPEYDAGIDEGYRRRLDSERSVHAEESLCARSLYARYHFDGALKKAGLKSLVVPAKDEYIAAVAAAQKAVCAKVHARGISIETNPTSNRKISSVEHYIDLPFIRLNRFGLTELTGVSAKLGPDIPLTINTDDSGVFQTDLAMEYALIVEALKRAECPHEEIYAYIDYLRVLSLHQSTCGR